LRFLFLPAGALEAPPALVADDQVLLRRTGEGIVASCPPALAGKIEVRGLGIVCMRNCAEQARLTLIADLDGSCDVPRYPARDEWETVLGVPIRRIVLNPFEMPAPIKLALALQNFFEREAS